MITNMLIAGQLSNLLLKMLSVLPSSIFGIYPDGTVFFWSEGAQLLTGIDTQKALGKNFQDLLSIPPDKFLLANLVDTKTSVSLDLKDKSSSPKRNLFLTLTPLFNEEQKLIGALGEIKDISEEKRLEQLKTDFTSMIAHELRTPASTIKGYLDVLQKDAKDFNPEHKEYLQRAYLSNERQIQTIESLFSAAQLEEGTLKIDPKPLDLIDALNKTMGEFSNEARAKGLELKLIYPHLTLPPVLADYTRLDEILRSLLGNAVKYTQKGSVTVSIKTEKDKVVVEIADTGPGIAPELQPRLFEKFVRGEHALTELTQGTGLGLYISRKLVEIMGGKIWYETRVGKGSTFYFSLPVFSKNSLTSSII